MRAQRSAGEDPIWIDLDALRGVVDRAKDLLSSEDHEALTKALEQIVALQRIVHERGTTIARLRRLFHLSGSEKTDDVLGRDESKAPASNAAENDATDGESSAKSKKGKNKGRTPCSEYKNANRISVPHPQLRPGSVCPACERGKVHSMKEPVRIMRLKGKPPIEADCFECEHLRCGACGEVFTAPAPEEAKGDKYTESAAAMIGVLHYGAGMPFNRLDKLQKHLQTPLPASTQWDLMRDRCERFAPVYAELLRRAAAGNLLHVDDTYACILELTGKRRRSLVASGELASPERTGIFTTGILARTSDEKQIALFFTGRKYAGENVARLLELRADELDPPVLVSDALARNAPAGHVIIPGYCVAHGRRNVVDEVENFPEECQKILESLRQVFANDAEAHRQNMSDVERLRYHQKSSGPILGQLRKWMRHQFRDRRVEENSGLGQAMRYLIDHWRNLTLFLRRAGVPLTNNIIERALKMVIRYRNNSYFFRSEKGARVGDVYMSLIHTAELHGANPFDYLTELQRHWKEVAERPDQWMPWNYRATLDGLASGPTAAAA